MYGNLVTTFTSLKFGQLVRLRRELAVFSLPSIKNQYANKNKPICYSVQLDFGLDTGLRLGGGICFWGFNPSP